MVILDPFQHLDQNTSLRGTGFTEIYLTHSEFKQYTQQLELESLQIACISWLL